MTVCDTVDWVCTQQLARILTTEKIKELDVEGVCDCLPACNFVSYEVEVHKKKFSEDRDE